MKTAAAYIRVSTDDQIEYSPDSQLKLLREFAKKNDYILPDEYIFQDDGISGKDTKHRPAFNQMIALAKSDEHPIDTILVWKFSRFARNQEESIVIKNLLRKINVEVRSISEPVDPDSAFGTLIERIIEWMDEYYLINLSGEVKRGMLERASRGEIVTPPSFGYIVENGTYIPHPNEAPIIRRIFESYLAGVGVRRIALTLGAEGIRTKRGNMPDNRFVEYILRNPVYIGKIRWSKDGRTASKRKYDDENILIIDGKHEPLIDTETFNAVQVKLDAQKKAYPRYQRKEQPVEFMLKGLVRCSSCGSTLCQSQKGKGLQCHKFATGKCSVSHYISFDKINKAVIEALEYSIATMNFSIKPQRHNTSVAAGSDIDKLLAAEYRKLDRVKAAYENGTDTLEEYAENKKKIQAAIKKLESQRPQQKNTFNKNSYAKKVSSVLKIVKSANATEHEKNEALRSVIDHITLHRPETSIDITFYN
ncbi:MAG: recombinase family protein [Clostridia bacterium]|nr:recombinase family protein [Clostridia bacterium]